jgi:hypothetical protein
MGNTSRIQNVSVALPYSSGSYSGFFGLGFGEGGGSGEEG